MNEVEESLEMQGQIDGLKIIVRSLLRIESMCRSTTVIA